MDSSGARRAVAVATAAVFVAAVMAMLVHREQPDRPDSAARPGPTPAGVAIAEIPDPLPATPALCPARAGTTPAPASPGPPLFEVSSDIPGPWRVGALGVYDGGEWRQEARSFTDLDQAAPGPQPGSPSAIFTLVGYEGPSLPVLPRAANVRAAGARLVIDHRTGSVRVSGRTPSPLTYEATSPAAPPIEALREAGPATAEMAPYLAAPAPPPEVARLLSRAPTTSPWDRWDHLRRTLLDNAVAAGSGTTVPIAPERVSVMLSGGEASPFELAAAQALLARWAGLPARVAYGFDGGDVVGDRTQVRAHHALFYVEVHVGDHGWLPVIGLPRNTRPCATQR